MVPVYREKCFNQRWHDEINKSYQCEYSNIEMHVGWGSTQEKHKVGIYIEIYCHDMEQAMDNIDNQKCATFCSQELDQITL
jgi:hypothetical protein